MDITMTTTNDGDGGGDINISTMTMTIMVERWQQLRRPQEFRKQRNEGAAYPESVLIEHISPNGHSQQGEHGYQSYHPPNVRHLGRTASFAWHSPEPKPPPLVTTLACANCHHCHPTVPPRLPSLSTQVKEGDRSSSSQRGDIP